MGYTKDAIKGISWMSGVRVVTRILAFLKIAVLARVLTPAQFGIFGIATLILSLLETLTETGINVVLIQSEHDLSEYINSAWVVSIFRGLIIAVLIFISTPFIASFFHTQDARGILFFISTVPLVRGFINPAEVSFQKELKFHLQFWFQSFLFFIGTMIAIIIAVLFHSVYSLVWGMLVSAIVEVILSFALIEPKPKFAIERGYFKEIFHKGSWVTAYTIFNYIAENADNAVVGRILGASALGFYEMAYNISILPISEICDVVSAVVFPVFTKISDQKLRLWAAFLKTVSLVFLGGVLAGAVLFFFPSQLISIFLGQKWIPIAPVLKVLAVYAILRTAAGPVSAFFLSQRKQNLVTAMVFIRFTALAVCIYPFVHLFGMVGAAYSQLIAVSVEFPVMLFFLRRMSQTK